MKLFLLRPVENLPLSDNPWEPWYDKCFGFVIRAMNEQHARGLAHAEAGDENRGQFLSAAISKTKAPWLDENYSTCIELRPNGAQGVILADVRSA